ncbi:hypothetical protein [Parafrankia discariae]|uniref:hypothetical protein n=1 Tax=Parafrankia discariae TaxID=365528 RepID=UPI000374ECA4|nr:hypothetical protein [Parafrankia discariae]
MGGTHPHRIDGTAYPAYSMSAAACRIVLLEHRLTQVRAGLADLHRHFHLHLHQRTPYRGPFPTYPDHSDS